MHPIDNYVKTERMWITDAESDLEFVIGYINSIRHLIPDTEEIYINSSGKSINLWVPWDVFNDYDLLYELHQRADSENAPKLSYSSDLIRTFNFGEPDYYSITLYLQNTKDHCSLRERKELIAERERITYELDNGCPGLREML